MGVSHSKSDDCVVGRSNKKMASKSRISKSDSKNNNDSMKKYGDKPRSVSSNDVLENGENAVQASSSSNSLASNLRSKIGSFRKPSFKSTKPTNNNNDDRSKTSSTSSGTVIQSFLTNVNGNANFSYPRAHQTTNLVLPFRESTNAVVVSSTKPQITGLPRPVQYRRGVGANYGRSVLHIPSPVASVSEPSASEENLSVEHFGAETRGNNVKLRYVDSPSQNSTSVSRSGANVDTTAADSKSSDGGVTTNEQASVGFRIKGARSINDGRDKATIDGQCTSEAEIEAAVATEETVARVERPNLLESFNGQAPRLPSSKLRYKGEAPLAQSESFIVENSPAIELPPLAPTANQQIMTSTSRIPTKLDGLSDGSKARTSIPTKIGATVTGTRLQSRLKNPTAYEQRQRFIYGQHGGAPGSKGGTKKSRDDAGAQTKPPIGSSGSGRPTLDKGAIQPKDVDAPVGTGETAAKSELHDSGVKIDSGGGTSGSDSNGSKATSPEGSLHRGLIDDEIRDQPELTFGKSDTSPAEQPSQITTIQEEIHAEFGGPVRLRDRNRKRSSANNRLIESYDSTVSSLSIDSEDLMVDYESLDYVDGVEKDSTGPAAFDGASLHSSLGRRSSRNSVGGTSSWGRRKSGNLASGGKRASVDEAIDELSLLKNETEKGSNHSQQRPRTFSDFPSPSSSSAGAQPFSSQSPSHHSRILRPPLTLECSGLSTVNLDQQTYRHVVQDVTVMKTLLLRLKRALQEAETTNPFENTHNLKNGLAKSALFDLETQKNEERIIQLTKDDLTEENATLRTQIAVMRQQLEEQNRIIQCLQYQLKHCRQRSLRKTGSVAESRDEERREQTEPLGGNGSLGTMATDV